MVGAGAVATTSDWRQALPVLTGSMVTLRELRLSDAPSLLAMLSTEEVSRFISPPPTTVEGFERFIAWTHLERAAVANGRGNGALRKVGAVQEGVLRKSFLRNGEYLDQTLWTILDDDWRRSRLVWGAQIH